MEIRQVRPEEYAEAGRVTALAYQEFAPPGDADWEAYLRVIADVAGQAFAGAVTATGALAKTRGCFAKATGGSAETP